MFLVVNDNLTKYLRSWHDARVITQVCTVTHTNQEKEGLGRQQKARPKVKLCALISPAPNAK